MHMGHEYLGDLAYFDIRLSALQGKLTKSSFGTVYHCTGKG